MDLEPWLLKHTKEIQIVQNILSQKLSDNPEQLILQLTEIEAWYSRLTTMLADADSFLDTAEQRELMTIDKEKKALDREVELKAKVVRERRLRDILQGLCDSTRSKVLLGQSLMRAHNHDLSRHAV